MSLRYRDGIVLKSVCTDHGFSVWAIVNDQGEPVPNAACPVACGLCCGYWRETRTLRAIATEECLHSPCPYLGEKGCVLQRESRPIECTAYLCELGILAVQGQVTEEEIKRVLDAGFQRGACEYLGKYPKGCPPVEEVRSGE